MKELVKKFGLENAKDFPTLMSRSNKGVGINSQEKNVDEKLYRSMIGNLLYLTARRPNISFSFRVCAKYQANPNKIYLRAIKWIIRYVKDTINYCIWYPMEISLDHIGYSDANCVGSMNGRKSTSGACFLVTVLWHGTERNRIALRYQLLKVNIAAGSWSTQLL